MLEDYINRQVELGTAQQWENLDECIRALEAEKRIQQHQQEFILCPQCGGSGKYYDISQMETFTCSYCAGYGKVPLYR